MAFGAARVRVVGEPGQGEPADTAPIAAARLPTLSERQMDVLAILCRPALARDAFVPSATARDIATELFVTEAAVKQHLLRLYKKFGIGEGPERRTRLANAVIEAGLIRPAEPPGEAGARQVV